MGSKEQQRYFLCKKSDLPIGEKKEFTLENGDVILAVNVGGVIKVVSGICTHRRFHLVRGALMGNSITCTLHLSAFDLDSGEPLTPPAEEPLKVYSVEIENDNVFVIL